MPVPAPKVQKDLVVSPIFKIRGQNSRWTYPNADKLTPDQCTKLRNVNLSEAGICESRRGYENWSPNGSLSEYITGLIYTPVKNDTCYLVVTPTKIYVDNGTTRTNVTGTVTLTVAGNNDLTRWCYAQNKILACNGKDEIWTHDADFTTPTNAAPLSFNASGVTITTCKDLVVHRNVVLALGTTESGTYYPTRIRWCDVNRETYELDTTVWPARNRFELYEGGAPIIGAVDAHGTLVVFKEDGVYPCRLAYDTGFIELKVDENNVRRGFSPVSTHSLIARPEFIFGAAKEGLFIIQPDFSYRLVTLDVKDEWEGFNPTRLACAQAYIREKDHQIRCLVSCGLTTSGADGVVVWDWETEDVWIDMYVDTLTYGTAVRSSDVEYDWLGTTTGGLYKGNVGIEDNGYPFEFLVQMAPNDLGYPGQVKTIVNLKALYQKRSQQQTIDLQIKRDLGAQATRPFTLKLNNGGTWNSGSDWNKGGGVWDTAVTETVTVFVNRDAELIEPIFRSQSPAALVGYQVEFIPRE